MEPADNPSPDDDPPPPPERRALMARIRGKNTKPELVVRRLPPRAKTRHAATVTQGAERGRSRFQRSGAGS